LLINRVLLDKLHWQFSVANEHIRRKVVVAKFGLEKIGWITKDRGALHRLMYEGRLENVEASFFLWK